MGSTVHLEVESFRVWPVLCNDGRSVWLEFYYFLAHEVCDGRKVSSNDVILLCVVVKFDSIRVELCEYQVKVFWRLICILRLYETNETIIWYNNDTY